MNKREELTYELIVLRNVLDTFCRIASVLLSVYAIHIGHPIFAIFIAICALVRIEVTPADECKCNGECNCSKECDGDIEVEVDEELENDGHFHCDENGCSIKFNNKED